MSHLLDKYIAPFLQEIKGQYPKASTILEISCKGNITTRKQIAQQWLSEGIPFAFKECPYIYEAIRCYISEKLKVNVKNIGVVGSARIGQLLKPNQAGKPFDINSDLDLFVVSETLFELMVSDFNLWNSSFLSGMVIPRNNNERIFWSDNSARIPKNIQRGFINSDKVPTLHSYKNISQINNTLSLLSNNLKKYEQLKIKPQKISIRCYKSWESFFKQVSLSLDVKEFNVYKE